jgi:hypothetical protein
MQHRGLTDALAGGLDDQRTLGEAIRQFSGLPEQRVGRGRLRAGRTGLAGVGIGWRDGAITDIMHAIGERNSMANHHGGCLCGQVRYTVSGEAVLSVVCHCRSCQRFTGSAFGAAIGFPGASVSDLHTYEDTGASGRPVHRRFCSKCGSGVVSEVDTMPGLAILLAGTLDDPAAFESTMEVCCSSAQPWGPCWRQAASVCPDATLITCD